MSRGGICTVCGGKTIDKRAMMCKACILKTHAKRIYYCSDCGKDVYYKSERCHQCSGHSRRGVNSSNWRGGPSKCVDCGTTIKNYVAKRCTACYAKIRKEEGYRAWIADDVEMLRQLYSRMPAKEVAHLMGRNVHAIYRKAYELGIKSDRRVHMNDNYEFLIGNPYQSVLTTEECAYIAGIFDGEGNFEYKQEKYWGLCVTNTNLGMIQWLCDKIRYSLARVAVQAGEHNKTCYNWRLSGNLKVKALLTLIAPYMIIKREKADFALKNIQMLDGDLLYGL